MIEFNTFSLPEGNFAQGHFHVFYVTHQQER